MFCMKAMKCNSDFMIVHNLFKTDNLSFIKIFVSKDDGFVSDLLMICSMHSCICIIVYLNCYK